MSVYPPDLMPKHRSSPWPFLQDILLAAPFDSLFRCDGPRLGLAKSNIVSIRQNKIYFNECKGYLELYNKAKLELDEYDKF